MGAVCHIYTIQQLVTLATDAIRAQPIYPYGAFLNLMLSLSELKEKDNSKIKGKEIDERLTLIIFVGNETIVVVVHLSYIDLQSMRMG